MLDMIEAPETTDAPNTDITTLPPAARAALVLNSTKTEADLKQLANSLKAITLVNSLAGREQAHAMAMTARTARTTIEKLGKAARDDATKFSKAVIAEEDRLIEIIQSEETRVMGLRNAWDAAEAARKEAEAQKERERIERHVAVITQIKGYPMLAATARTSDMMLQLLQKLHNIDISGLEEFLEQARGAMIAADKSLLDLIDTKKAEEAEAARIKAEQEAEAARLAEERQRMEAERAEAARVAAEQQAELMAQQARMKAQQEELDRRAAAMAQQDAEMAARKEQAEQAERDKLEEQQRLMNLEHATLLEQTADLVAPAVLASDPAEALAQVMAAVPHAVVVQQPATVDEMHAIGNGIMYDPNTQETPSAITLIRLIAHDLDVESATAIRWLAERADEFKTLHESNK